MAFTQAELVSIRGLLEALLRKCKTVGLYEPTRVALIAVNREIDAHDK